MGRPVRWEGRGAWGQLIEAYGGVGAFARVMCVSDDAVRDWSRGVQPRSVWTRKAINAAARLKGIPEPYSDEEE